MRMRKNYCRTSIPVKCCIRTRKRIPRAVWFTLFIITDWRNGCFRRLLQRIVAAAFRNKVSQGFGNWRNACCYYCSRNCLHYVSDTRQEQLKHISSISRIDEDKYVWLDKFTIHQPGACFFREWTGCDLLDVLDHTLTPMGGRLLKHWVMLPLKDISAIEERRRRFIIFSITLNFPPSSQGTWNKQVISNDWFLKGCSRENFSREVMQLKRSLDMVQLIKRQLRKYRQRSIRIIADQLNPCTLINSRMANELPWMLPLLGEQRRSDSRGSKFWDWMSWSISLHGKDYLLKIQQREAERTGISSLKVGFNNVFGYYIEVTHTPKNKVPSTGHESKHSPMPTLHHGRVKTIRRKILARRKRSSRANPVCLRNWCRLLQSTFNRYSSNAALIGRLDVLLSFSDVGTQNEYVRSCCSEWFLRHWHPQRSSPGDWKTTRTGEKFVTNDIYLDNDTQQILMITGPNMSGKSTLLGQTTLITLLAQTGSFVPASAATIGFVDKIFTRVGASDNISSGESTFHGGRWMKREYSP